MTQKENILNVQCFVKNQVKSHFLYENAPNLLYVSKISPTASVHPRVMHAHDDFMEIILICSGESEYLIHNKKHNICGGDLLVYNAGVVHDEISGQKAEVGSYCVAIGGIQLPNLPMNTITDPDVQPIFKTGSNQKELEELCEIMYQTLKRGNSGAEVVSTHLMMAFLEKVMVIVEAKENAEKPQDTEPHMLGKQIKEYIDSHYMEPITLQSMAKELYISPYYLSHVFKEMSGYSPMQYLLRRRIGEAQTLLISTDYSIIQISEMVGYDTQSYFNLQFTKNVGISPKKYRKNYIVNNE